MDKDTPGTPVERAVILMEEISISMKRIADSLETLPQSIGNALQDAIWNATRK